MDSVIGNIPKTKTSTAIWVFCVNLFLPGIGTIILGCILKPKDEKVIKAGIYQFILALFLVGFILSIYWGYKLLEKAKEEEEEELKRKLNNATAPIDKAADEAERKKNEV
jgi:hypothetical protein